MSSWWVVSNFATPSVAYKMLLTEQFVVLGHILSYIWQVTLSLNKMDCIEYRIPQNSCMRLAHEISFQDFGIKVSLCCKWISSCKNKHFFFYLFLDKMLAFFLLNNYCFTLIVSCKLIIFFSFLWAIRTQDGQPMVTIN